MSESQSIPAAPAFINEVIRTRRSVFTQQFDPGKPVDDEIIWKMLQNANWAPTHKRTEPWRFTVFSGDQRKTLAERQSDIYKTYAGAQFKQGKYEQLKRLPLLSSHVIVIGMKRNPVLPEMEEIAAVACAVQNMALTAHAYGVGAYWSTGGITFIEEAKPLFHLGPEDRLMGFFYVGQILVPSGEGHRGNIEEKVTWIK